MPKPSYAQVFEGETSITIPYGTGTIELLCSWEVAAESLDYRIEEMKTLRNDGSLAMHYHHDERSRWKNYLVPSDLKRPDLDCLIRQELWTAIEDQLPPLKQECYYVA